MIKLNHLTFKYNHGKKNAIEDINVEIDEGEFILISGPSGCGKSTMIRTLNGLVPHFYGGKITGSINVYGLNPIISNVRDMAQLIGYVFQIPDNQLFMNEVENEIAFGMENLGFHEDTIKKRIEETLDAIGISHLRKRSTKSLSGGEKQKVALASVLCLHPKVLVLDEPTSELDPKSAEDILLVLQKLNAELGITIILIEHRLERILPFIDRVILMNKGKIKYDGEPKDVFLEKEENLGIGLPPMISLAKTMGNDKIPLSVKSTRKIMRTALQKYTINTDKWETILHSILEKRKIVNSNGGTNIIQVKDVSHSYSDEKNILDGINLSFSAGEFVAIMGRNGSGKTTLLKSLIKLISVKKGNILYNKTDYKSISVEDLAGKIGYLFQNPSLLFYQDRVFDEVEFILKNLGMKKKERSQAVEQILEDFEIENYKNQYPRYLSVGEQQRVALASILVAEPKILLLDEPTHGMDYFQKIKFLKMLDQYRKKGNLVILVTHDVETIAKFADRVILMSEGKVIVDDETHQVLSEALLFSPQINRLIQGFDQIPNSILTIDELTQVMEADKK